MIIPIAYNIALIFAVYYVWRYGGRTGRYGSTVVLIGSILSWLAVSADRSYSTVLMQLFLIDCATLTAKIAIAIYSTRRWPIWAAAFQLNVVAAHTAGIISPELKNSFYYAMITVWAIPGLLIMVLGTAMDRQHDLRRARLIRDNRGLFL